VKSSHKSFTIFGNVPTFETILDKLLLKALKNSTLYKETIDLDNIKDIKFKTKVKEKEKNEDEPDEDDFYKCLSSLILKNEDPYLTSIFEHVLFGKEDISDKDILFM